MNCQDFNELLFDYLDGTPAARTQAEIDRHLAACEPCRKILAEHRRVANELSRQLRQRAQSLTLAPETRQRIMAALLSGAAKAGRPAAAAPFRLKSVRPLLLRALSVCEALAGFFKPAARRWALAGSLVALVVLVGALWQGPHGAGLATAAAAEPNVTVSARIPQTVTLYRFHREGEFVTDALVTRAGSVQETFQPKHRSKPSAKTPIKEMSI